MPTYLLIIDPQVDFHPGGNLAVVGANEDSARLAEFIHSNVDKIDEIFVTLDSHQRLHIAHALFWQNRMGERPAPFTLISKLQVDAGEWHPSQPEFLEYCQHYTAQLEANGRFQLCIWPEHCLIGTPGHNVVPVLNEALLAWSGAKLKTIHYVMKGTNSLTEHYSALKADVEIPDDPSTGLNVRLITQLQGADKVIVCGQALSHCVNFTVRDLAESWPLDKLAQLTIVRDGASPVPGFESAGETFVTDMRAKGLTVTTFAEL